MPNAQVGPVRMLQGLLPLRLNCPWRAPATTAMVRSSSTLLGTKAAIGAVPLVAPAQALSTSTVPVPVPLCSPKVARKVTLCVALRISPFASLGFGAEA